MAKEAAAEPLKDVGSVPLCRLIVDPLSRGGGANPFLNARPAKGSSCEIPANKTDPRLRDLNSPDYEWRCPCCGLPCDQDFFETIQDLVLHMRAAHGLSIVPFDGKI